MADMNETPRGNRIHIAFFGLRNAGKSTLVNAFTGQELAIVSATPGTTTDPVSKAMEILPLGPCLVTDTAGLDDEGALGAQRVAKTLKVLETTDIAVWVFGEDGGAVDPRVRSAAAKNGTVLLEYRRGESVEALKARIAAVRPETAEAGLLDGLVEEGARVLLVCPIDESAPKGRLILPQQQVLRECLDRHLTAAVCQPAELSAMLAAFAPNLVVTDSQAFGEVRAALTAVAPKVPLTSFSILFARQKGDLAAYTEGLKALDRLRDGDLVLVAEGCTHHRQCKDIGTTKIPQTLVKLTGRKLRFVFASGADFPLAGVAFAVQCGGCMLTRREVLRRIGLCRAAGVPIVNYGLLLARGAGVGALFRVAAP